MAFNPFPNVTQCLLIVAMVMVAHTKECRDTGKMCWWWSLMKWCSPKNSYSKNECPKRCNLCPDDPVSLSPSSVTTYLPVMQSTPVMQVTPVTPSIPVTHAASTNALVASSISPTGITPPPPPSSSSSPTKDCKLPTLPFSQSVLRDMSMVGHVLHKQVVVTEAHCEDLCLRAHLCKGYNFNIDQNGNKNCELLDHIQNFSPHSGSVFRLFDRDAAIKGLLGHGQDGTAR